MAKQEAKQLLALVLWVYEHNPRHEMYYRWLREAHAAYLAAANQ